MNKLTKASEKEYFCDEFDNMIPRISLKQLEELLPKLKKRYGANAKLKFDAGYNNVCVLVEPSKKSVT